MLDHGQFESSFEQSPRTPLQMTVKTLEGRLHKNMYVGLIMYIYIYIHICAVEADLNATITPTSTAAVRILQQNKEPIIAAFIGLPNVRIVRITIQL